MIPLTIRPATDDDVPALRKLVNAAFQGLSAMGINSTSATIDEEGIRQRLREREIHLAFHGDRLAATIATDLREQNGQPTLFVSQLAVWPDLGRQGIGRFLMDYVEGLARQRSIGRLGLNTATNAHHLVRFYSGLGFRCVDEVQLPGSDHFSYIMEKNL